jgi:glycosyltransferase involved in cell wall biosynthesis
VVEQVNWICLDPSLDKSHYMKILFLSRWFPYPPDNGAKLRVYNLLQRLSIKHQVDLISFIEQNPEPSQMEIMGSMCGKIETVLYKPFEPGSWKAILGFFSLSPRSVTDTYLPEFQHVVNDSVHSRNPDLIIASQIDMAPYARTAKSPLKILEEIELGSLYEQYSSERHPIRRVRRGMMWWKVKNYVARLLKDFDATTVVSQIEAERIRPFLPPGHLLEILPNAVDTNACCTENIQVEPDMLIYTGALSFEPNFDAVRYFLGHILPYVRTRRPAVRLSVTGSIDSVPIEMLGETNGTIFTGWLEDVRPVIARSWISVVPLRRGGGTRLKILESLSIGTPVVSTSKGAEGLDLIPGKEILIADDPEDFAEQVLQLLSNPELREELSQNGRRAVEERYDWNMVSNSLERLIEMVVLKRFEIGTTLTDQST